MDDWQLGKRDTPRPQAIRTLLAPFARFTCGKPAPNFVVRPFCCSLFWWVSSFWAASSAADSGKRSNPFSIYARLCSLSNRSLACLWSSTARLLILYESLNPLINPVDSFNSGVHFFANTRRAAHLLPHTHLRRQGVAQAVDFVFQLAEKGQTALVRPCDFADDPAVCNAQIFLRPFGNAEIAAR